jgi:hypothetical protein
MTRGDTLQSSLTDILTRCRAAVLSNSNTSISQEAQEVPPKDGQVSLPSPSVGEASRAITGQVRVRREVPTLNAGEVHDLQGLKAGPRALFELLFEVAQQTAHHRKQGNVSQTVIHQPGEILAAALGVSRVTMYKYLHTLKEAGLLAFKGHVGNWYGLARRTGTVFAVSMRAGYRAQLYFHDLKHEWRDLTADTQQEKTAWGFLKGLQSHPERETASRTALKAWALFPGQTHIDPLKIDCKDSLGTVLDVVYALPSVSEAHPTKRAALVGVLGAALASLLGDQHSRRYWCRVIWDAWRDEIEGRSGLQLLQAQLSRLEADRREWRELRNPAALFAARLR